jgi:hypothetical protein
VTALCATPLNVEPLRNIPRAVDQRRLAPSNPMRSDG